MDSWTDHLLWIPLGLRSAAREYDKITPCQAVFSLPLILPNKFLDSCSYLDLLAVLRIRIRIGIHRIHMFLGLPDPDPLVRGMGPDPSIIMQK
jgi:hypothetical protein